MNLYYQEYGDRDASLMVFLHGGGVSSWMWDKQVQYFTDYHCVTVDLPEQGQRAQESEFSIKNSAYRIIELINQLANGKDIVVIGFSLGAQILVQMLSDRSDLITYAIISSALVKPNKLGAKIISPLIRLTFPLIKNKTFSKLQAKALFISEDHFAQYYNESSQMKSKTLVRILKENMLFQIPAGFSDAKGKILVTVGDKEKAGMKKSASKIVRSNENCTGVIIPKVGHGLPLSHPNLFNQLIEEWIHGKNVPEEYKEIG